MPRDQRLKKLTCTSYPLKLQFHHQNNDIIDFFNLPIKKHYNKPWCSPTETKRLTWRWKTNFPIPSTTVARRPLNLPIINNLTSAHVHQQNLNNLHGKRSKLSNFIKNKYILLNPPIENVSNKPSVHQQKLKQFTRQ